MSEEEEEEKSGNGRWEGEREREREKESSESCLCASRRLFFVYSQSSHQQNTPPRTCHFSLHSHPKHQHHWPGLKPNGTFNHVHIDPPTKQASRAGGKSGRRRSYEGRRARGLGRRHWGRLGHAPRLSATPALGPHCDEGMGTLLPSLVVLNCHHRCHHHRQQRLQRTKAQQIPEKKR